MNQDLTARVTTTVNAPIEKVWDALTKPELVKQYFFGVDLVTDWEEGSDILYKGEWEGEKFEEKGTVLAVEKPHKIVSNYWSPSSGLPDTIDNRQVITYLLEETGNGTKLTIEQDNNKTRESAEQSEANWKTIADGLKSLVEPK